MDTRRLVDRTAAVFVTAWGLAAHVSAAADAVRGIVPPPGIERVEALEQNWSDEEANWFYDAPQGSRLVPYDWFLALEQPGSAERFLAPEHIRGLGLIPRLATSGNPDALPIGLVRDAPYDDGTPGLGVTCAACHTALISHGTTAYVIDGGPSAGDIERFLRRLTAALGETAAADGRFGRFAARVMPHAGDAEHQALRDALRGVVRERVGYNDRNLPAADATPHGPGRIDAFGAIFNEVSATFLDMPGNVRAADAPVSYPCLWDTPQHDRVQWNGIAINRESILGAVIFGERQVGALGRNTGQVLGVFGSTRVNDHELLIPRRYESTINKDNLREFERTLADLWSPRWPTALGPLDAAQVSRGAVVYQTHCAACHAVIRRDDPHRRITAAMRAVGTDARVLTNTDRVVETGRLAGRKRTLQGLDRFGNQAPVADILKHVVERVMLEPLDVAALRDALRKVVNAPELVGPAFRASVEISFGGRSEAADVSGITESDDTLTLYGAAADLDGLRERLGLARDGTDSLRLPAGRVTGAYKARPLNGVWATAPYLHNGSVPTLAALLEPAARRPATFHVGSTEFDPQRVGFIEDPRRPVFDTSLLGNSRQGHEYGTDLSAPDKADLLEFLRSL